MSHAYTARQAVRSHTVREIADDRFGGTLEQRINAAITGSDQDTPHTRVVCSCGDIRIAASRFEALTMHGRHLAEVMYAALPVTPPPVVAPATRRRAATRR